MLCRYFSQILIVSFLMVQCTFASDIVVIHITGPGSNATYVEDGQASEQPVTVQVGQTVRWANDHQTTTRHTATSIEQDENGNALFSTGNIDVGEQADVLVDRELYERAGGVLGESIEIEYFCARHPSLMRSSLVIEDGESQEPVTAGTNRATGLVRKSIATLSASEIASLRRGIEVMKSRPVSDRTSWRYWANIHGTIPSNDPLWNQCEHGTVHFFTWHRAYLIFFEQILRDASGDSSLSLPYWDWSTNRMLPLAYRSPAAPTNSLFDPRRQMNDGSSLSSRIVVTDLNNALQQSRFSDFSFALDGSPHGTVHTLVGGAGGTMSRIGTSANDPIFYVHHANVDRLWNRWLAIGGHANPNDSAFLNRTFTFVAPNGTNATIRVRDVLDQSRLDYRYDDDPTLVPPRIAVQFVSDSDNRPRRLGLDPEIVEVAVPKTVMSALRASQAASRVAPHVLIDVEGIQFREVPSFVYGVYIDLPKGETNEERLDLHYVGSLSFFVEDQPHGATAGHDDDVEPSDTGEATKFTESVDATKAIQRLRAAGVNIGDELTVTLRPITLVPPPGREQEVSSAARASADRAQVTYESIRVRLSDR